MVYTCAHSKAGKDKLKWNHTRKEKGKSVIEEKAKRKGSLNAFPTEWRWSTRRDPGAKNWSTSNCLAIFDTSE